jgi:hypothetical protein
MSKGASTVLALVGATLIGYGQGRDAERDRSREQALVSQATAMKEAVDQLRGTMVVAASLQDRIAENAKQQQQFISDQQGKANDLVAQLQSIPVPADCAYTPDERRRLLNIHIRRPATGHRTPDPSR